MNIAKLNAKLPALLSICPGGSRIAFPVRKTHFIDGFFPVCSGRYLHCSSFNRPVRPLSSATTSCPVCKRIRSRRKCREKPLGLIVGQDWGDVTALTKITACSTPTAMRAGSCLYDTIFGQLLSWIKLTGLRPPQWFFTNAYLFLRSGSIGSTPTPRIGVSYKKACARALKYTILKLKPKKVVLCGAKAVEIAALISGLDFLKGRTLASVYSSKMQLMKRVVVAGQSITLAISPHWANIVRTYARSSTLSPMLVDDVWRRI